MIGTLFVGVVCLLLYIAPTMVAAKRKHRNVEGIFLLNIFLGWTFIGWIIALVWAVKKDANYPTL